MKNESQIIRQALPLCPYCGGDPSAWEDVSGEPPNFLCDEHGSTIEDGTIAKRVLLGTDTGPGWGGDDWPPPELPEEVAS